MASKDPKFQSFLSDLHEARTYRGISLDVIARETRIPLPSLEFLESGEWQHIDKPFLRGHLIDYAEAVGMVREKVLKRYDALNFQYPDESGTSKPTLDQPKPFTGNADSSTGAEAKVPTLWEVLPLAFKLSLGAVLALMFTLFLFLISILPGSDENGVLKADSKVDPQPISSITQQASTSLNGDASGPFEVIFALSRPASLRAYTQDSLFFDATLKADSMVQILSPVELILHVERLEDFRLQLDGLLQEIPPDSGRHELRILRSGLKHKAF
jgi:hypothetical protein